MCDKSLFSLEGIAQRRNCECKPASVSDSPGLPGYTTGKLNRISSLVNEQLLYIANDKPKMNINGVEFIDQHWVKTTLEDINRILCG